MRRGAGGAALLPLEQLAAREADTAAGSGVAVYVRCRPLAQGEESGNPGDAMRSLLLDPAAGAVHIRDRYVDTKQFSFSGVLGPTCGQRAVFEAVGRPCVAAALRGLCGTVLAYGQTGSGKTYTAFGPAGCADSDPQAGLASRCVRELFAALAQRPRASASLQYLQLYNDTLTDLLSESGDSLVLRDEERGARVEGAREVAVSSAQQVFRLLGEANSRRVVRLTEMNAQSSRSHAICHLSLQQPPAAPGQDDWLQGRLTIVDLAGSERLKRSRADGQRRREAQAINLSLTCLGNVIHALTDPRATHVPFRACKLTRILRDSVGTRGAMRIVVTISPALGDVSETLGALQFGARALCVRQPQRPPPAPPEPRELAAALQQRCAALSERAAELEGEVARLQAERGELAAAAAEDGELIEQLEAALRRQAQQEAQLRERLGEGEERLCAAARRICELEQGRRSPAPAPAPAQPGGGAEGAAGEEAAPAAACGRCAAAERRAAQAEGALRESQEREAALSAELAEWRREAEAASSRAQQERRAAEELRNQLGAKGAEAARQSGLLRDAEERLAAAAARAEEERAHHEREVSELQRALRDHRARLEEAREMVGRCAEASASRSDSVATLSAPSRETSVREVSPPTPYARAASQLPERSGSAPPQPAQASLLPERQGSVQLPHERACSLGRGASLGGTSSQSSAVSPPPSEATHYCDQTELRSVQEQLAAERHEASCARQQAAALQRETEALRAQCTQRHADPGAAGLLAQLRQERDEDRRLLAGLIRERDELRRRLQGSGASPRREPLPPPRQRGGQRGAGRPPTPEQQSARGRQAGAGGGREPRGAACPAAQGGGAGAARRSPLGELQCTAAPPPPHRSPAKAKEPAAATAAAAAAAVPSAGAARVSDAAGPPQPPAAHSAAGGALRALDHLFSCATLRAVPP